MRGIAVTRKFWWRREMKVWSSERTVEEVVLMKGRISRHVMEKLVRYDILL